MRVLGLVCGSLELVVGIPLALVTGQQLGRFSLFALAPISCLILIVLLVWPNLWGRLSADGDAAQGDVHDSSPRSEPA
jgi:fumarate reductase subunit D